MATAHFKFHKMTQRIIRTFAVAYRQPQTAVGNSSKDLQLSAKALEVVANKSAITYFQPIVDLKTGSILGYEALIRGPVDSELHMPHELLASYHGGAAGKEMELLCYQRAIENAADYQLAEKLFINISAEHIHELFFCREAHQENDREDDPIYENLVFEINDCFTNSALLLEMLTKRRFAIAVGNWGLGHPGPQSLTEMRPEYVKIDRSVIQNVNMMPYQKALMAALVEVSRTLGAKVIAVGIETREELNAVIEAGVDYGQGFLLAAPAKKPLGPNEEVIKYIQLLQAADLTLTTPPDTFGVSIGDICQTTPTVTSGTLVNNMKGMLLEGCGQGVVVADNQKPVGLLMSNTLYYHLGGPYGVSLYYKRPVDRIMDRHPLIVDASLPLEAAATMAMARPESKLYDLMIVVKEGNYLGAVSIIHLLKNLTHLQLRSAANSNPLTGLPGNLVIEERLKKAVGQQRKFAVMYLDLDNFKAFNDKYGFEMGDKVLLLTASLLNSSIAAFSSNIPDFIGHIGGDDFVIITQPEKVEKLSKQIIRNFDKQICHMYDEKDLAHGYIQVRDRKGNIDRFPIMSISIAAVDNLEYQFQNYLEIGELVARLKKKAKRLPGSVLVGM